jgi:hypothetical protein
MSAESVPALTMGVDLTTGGSGLLKSTTATVVSETAELPFPAFLTLTSRFPLPSLRQ